MPSSLFADMEQRGSSSSGSSNSGSSEELGGGGGGGGGGGNGHHHLHPEPFDERRALQIALDQLSLLGLDAVPGPGPAAAASAAAAAASAAGDNSNGGGGGGDDVEEEMEDDEEEGHHHHHHQLQQQSVSHAALLLFGGGGGGGGLGGVGVLDANLGSCKRGNNTTECVAVPSSEHVAEIVGRQGCKIKALRAKTNTYIKTPVRGEEPVFVITGRQEDVAMAKREILSAAEHFSVIRASRNKPGALGLPSGPVPGPPPPVPGQTTIQVRVPYRVVGLVVGPKGATIKRIQQGTHTYIVTPSRDKEPVFEVTGMPENVDRAREEIEAHIALRTGGLIEFNDENDFHVNGTDVGFDNGGNGGGYQPGSLWIRPPRKPFSTNRNDSSSSLGSGGSTSDSHLGGGSGGSGGGGSSSNGGRYSADFSPTSPFGSSGGFGFGDSLTSLSSEELLIESTSGALEAGPTALLWAHFERTNPLAVLGSLPGQLHGQGGGGGGAAMRGRHSVAAIITNGSRLSPTFGTDNGPLLVHPLARRARSDPLTQGLPKYGPSPPELGDSCGSGNESDGSLGSGFGGTASGSPGEMADAGEGRAARDCAVCRESAVTAALVPCGHNLFCMECASGICEKGEEPRCPVCLTSVTQAIRIFS